MSRRIQLHSICGKTFLQTELFLDRFSRETRPFQQITSLGMRHWVLIIILCLTIRSETSGTNQGKMERRFSSKLNFQPDRSVPLTFRPKFRLHHKEIGLGTRIFVNGTAQFSRTGLTGQTGPHPEVASKYFDRTEPKRTSSFDFIPKFPEILA